jgi:hypothetical protein
VEAVGGWRRTDRGGSLRLERSVAMGGNNRVGPVVWDRGQLVVVVVVVVLDFNV